MSESQSPKVSLPKVTVGGKEIDLSDISSLVVKKDLDQPDYVQISLSNLGDTSGGSKFSAILKPGTDLVVKIKVEGEGEQELFKGFVHGDDPTYDAHSPVSTDLQGMNAMHKLTRGRKTRTFTNQTDQQIIQKVVSEAGLSVNFGREPPALRHEHLHQNNMTDLEFIRMRAARTGRVIFCEDKTLYYTKREKDQGPVAKLDYNTQGTGALENFKPKMSAAAQVKKVVCHGWDPFQSTRESQKMECKAEGGASPLGGESGSSAFGDNPEVHVFDIPFRSKEEGDLLAKSILEERQMNFINAEATGLGNSQIKPGKVIELQLGGKESRFNGKYYVVGCEFSYSHSSSGMGEGSGMGGFKGKYKLQRDAGM
ncbi:MAG TPA: contractile injection system protein, VgrG/Pvc8 family [Pseudomonadota bacterium]|nr:contractile injection system protein, VgrG/Pvc8 family [Pseudomonadota bacterium]